MKTTDDAEMTWGDTGSGTMDPVRSVVVRTGGGERSIGAIDAAREGGNPSATPERRRRRRRKIFWEGSVTGRNSFKIEKEQRLNGGSARASNKLF